MDIKALEKLINSFAIAHTGAGEDDWTIRGSETELEQLIALAREGLEHRKLGEIFGNPHYVKIYKLAEWAQDVAKPALEHFSGANGNNIDFCKADEALEKYPKE